MRVDLGWLWHGLGASAANTGLLFLLRLAQLPLWAIVIVLVCMAALAAFGGTVRERWQHGWKPAKDLTAHQWIEALAWPVGALVPAVAAPFIF